MDRCGQFNFSRTILAPPIDVANHGEISHNFPNYSNRASLCGCMAANFESAQGCAILTCPTQHDMSSTSNSVTALPTMVSLGYMPLSGIPPSASYSSLYNSMSVGHCMTQIPIVPQPITPIHYITTCEVPEAALTILPSPINICTPQFSIPLHHTTIPVTQLATVPVGQTNTVPITRLNTVPVAHTTNVPIHQLTEGPPVAQLMAASITNDNLTNYQTPSKHMIDSDQVNSDCIITTEEHSSFVKLSDDNKLCSQNDSLSKHTNNSRVKGNSRLKRKILRNKGLCYVSASGRQVEAKKYKDKDCGCKNKCLTKLGTKLDRKNIFSKFWNIGQFTVQNAYLSSCVTLIPNKPKGKQINNCSKYSKTVTRIFSVNMEENGSPVKVCKSMFLSLHGVSNGRLDRILQVVNCIGSSASLSDKRGHHRPSNKTADADIKEVSEHITLIKKEMADQFPGIEVPSDISLDLRDISVKRMYSHYQEKCKSEGKIPVSIWMYRNIERNKTNDCELTHVSPSFISTDTCMESKKEIIKPTLVMPETTLFNNLPDPPENHIPEDLAAPSEIVTVPFVDPFVHTISMTRDIKKSKRNLGEAYITSSGKLIKGKTYYDNNCKCKHRCIPDVGIFEERQAIFNNFWKLGDFNKQNLYISQLVTLVPIKQKFKKSSESNDKYCKTYSRLYSVKFKPNRGVVRVCKVAFLQLHGISNGRMDRIIQAVACQAPYAFKDRRGNHPPKNKTPAEDLECVNEQISKFLYEHNIKESNHIDNSSQTEIQKSFSRSSNIFESDPQGDDIRQSKFMLEIRPEVNIEKMFQHYKKYCDEEGRHPVSCFVYRKTIKKRLVSYSE